MQQDNGMTDFPPYSFSRNTGEALDTLMMQRRGPPSQPNGLTRSLFRPSDDAVTLPYNIPGNAMACVELRHLESLLKEVQGDDAFDASIRNRAADLYQRSTQTSEKICSALQQYVETNDVLPYEVDGFGSFYRMDDANLPSLLSLPLLGYLSSDHSSYQRTRAYVLSSHNPYYFSGPAGRGIGGPHEGVNLTWPMSITVQAMTSNSDSEVLECLHMLATTTADTGFMHEAFNVHNARAYTRPWFAWANGLFGELILQILGTKPELLVKDKNAVETVKKLVRPTVSYLAQQEVLVH
jgi:uncharacterized protein